MFVSKALPLGTARQLGISADVRPGHPSQSPGMPSWAIGDSISKSFPGNIVLGYRGFYLKANAWEGTAFPQIDSAQVPGRVAGPPSQRSAITVPDS